MELSSSLPDVELDEVELHMQEQRLLASMFGWEPKALQFGHYVILEELGRGGMGVVYAAYDRRLDRKVAIKRMNSLDDLGERSQLEREAKAMAKLAHPNVVQVYEIGGTESEAERPYIVMEYVEGQTLRDWLERKAGRRSRAQILEVFCAAGRGLAAAHAEGLVHRDFKPDNVMVRADGRVLVMDFGLARRERGEPTRTVSSAGELSRDQIAGSPAYMAPEQLAGEDVDARADQFAFCVSLWEALCGERPFAADSIEGLAQALEGGAPRSVDPRLLPAWLRRVLERGLAREPDARFESMQPLLVAITREPGTRVRKLGLGLALVMGVGVGAWGLGHQRALEGTRCAGLDAPITALWNEPTRVRVDATLRATGLGYAAQTSVAVAEGLDAYAARWGAGREEACQASERGTQSGELLDRRMSCLDRQLAHFGELVAALETADVGVLERATSAVEALPDVAHCADAEALRQDALPQDPVLAARVRERERELARARALYGAGRYADARMLTRAILADEEVLAHRPLEARARVFMGNTLRKLGRFEQAELELRGAYALAVELELPEQAARAAIELIWLVGDDLERHEDAREWAFHGRAQVDAADSEPWRAALHAALGGLAEAEASYVEARAQLRRAYRIYETLGAEGKVADVLNTFGVVEDADGNYEAAYDYYRRALAIQQRRLGSAHPQVAALLNNLGVLTYNMARYAEARELLERALLIREASVGPRSDPCASTLNNLGMVADVEGRREQARGYYERALSIWRELRGPHPLVARALTNLGVLSFNGGERERALRELQEAEAILEHSLGPDHAEIALVRINLGALRAELGELEQARADYERAHELWLGAHGPEHPYIGVVEVNLGELEFTSGELDRAREHFERAQTVFLAALGEGHPNLVYPLLGLAKVAREGGELARACELLPRARQLSDKGGVDDEQLEQLELLLAECEPS